jgi:hypothetical protein
MDEPSKFSDILCQLSKGTYLQVMEAKDVEGVEWMRVPPGWLCSMDQNGFQCYEDSNEVSANKSWAVEFDNRRRMTGAATAALTRMHSLPNGRRVARAIYNHVHGETTIHLVNLPDVSIEDLMVGLRSSQGLRQAELLEFLKVAASQQSNPPKTLKDMAKEIYDTMGMRPTLWIKEDMNVIETVDVATNNDQFVMAAAHGNVKALEKFLAIGQELAAIHTELKYTALHAAADFGHRHIVEMMIKTGMSVNIRDGRNGQTPLHFAGQSNRCEIARDLLDAGADRTIKSYKGLLPYQLADQQGNFECREILKHPPPAIQYVTVVDCTTRTIHLRWDAPILHEHTHSRVNDYVVEWDPVGKVSEVGHGDRFYTSAHEYKIRNLRPSSGHGFKIFSRSAAGWSEGSSQMIQFTLPACPESPPPVEMLRLATNAIYLAWHPPSHDNGAKIDMYQLELIDCEMGKEKDRQEKEAEARRKSEKKAKKLAKQKSQGGGLPLPGLKQVSYSDAALERKSMDEDDEDADDGSEFGSDDDDEDDEEEQEEEEEEGDEYEDEDEGMEGLGIDLENSTVASRQGPGGPQDSVTVGSSLRDMGSVPEPPKSKVGGQSMMHRMYKHKQTHKREKLCMGLEPFRPYQCRVRCRNELGYSRWSEWIGPIVPQPGVYVLEFNREERSARVGWFRPFLSNDRKVTHFEAQLAQLDGPMERDISIFTQERTEKGQVLNYNTIDDGLTTNEIILHNLKAGCKYRVRVRCEIDGTWSPWGHAFVSDPIHVPACAPENPFHARPCKRPAKDLSSVILSATDENGETPGGADSLDGGASMASASSMGTAVNPGSLAKGGPGMMGTDSLLQSVLETGDSDEAMLDVTHNTITIEWTNGNTNGSPAQEFIIEMAKIRDYSRADMEAAAAAAHDPVHGSYTEGETVIMASTQTGASTDETTTGLNKASTTDSGDDDASKSGSESGSDDEGDDGGKAENGDDISLTSAVLAGSSITSSAAAGNLKWQDISNTQGHMLGPSSFRVTGLIPGSTYVFRVKMRNEYGWSDFSPSTKMIKTYPCMPTSMPFPHTVNSQYVYIQWNETDGVSETTGLTNLSYEVESGRVPLGENTNVHAHTVNWEVPEIREVPEICNKPLHGVMIDKLFPGAQYVFRVRVRTIAGWSAWSEISDIIRTPN